MVSSSRVIVRRLENTIIQFQVAADISLAFWQDLRIKQIYDHLLFKYNQNKNHTSL